MVSCSRAKYLNDFGKYWIDYGSDIQTFLNFKVITRFPEIIPKDFGDLPLACQLFEDTFSLAANMLTVQWQCWYLPGMMFNMIIILL